MKLLLNLVRKDFKRNPAITTALLMAGGLRVAGTMLPAYDGLNQKAMNSSKRLRFLISPADQYNTGIF